MSFASRVESGIRSGAVSPSMRSKTPSIVRVASHKIAETDPRYVRGYLKVNADGTVTAKASGDLIGRIDGLKATHAGTNETVSASKTSALLSKLAVLHNAYVSTLREDTAK